MQLMMIYHLTLYSLFIFILNHYKAYKETAIVILTYLLRQDKLISNVIMKTSKRI